MFFGCRTEIIPAVGSGDFINNFKPVTSTAVNTFTF